MRNYADDGISRRHHLPPTDDKWENTFQRDKNGRYKESVQGMRDGEARCCCGYTGAYYPTPARV